MMKSVTSFTFRKMVMKVTLLKMWRTLLNLNPAKLTRIPKCNYTQGKTGMTDPILYQSNNEITRKLTSEALEELSSKIKWKKLQAKILDVGSGDGGVTSDILKSFIPRNFEKLVGVDVSPEMVTLANLHHKEDRVEFKVMDIVARTADLVKQFDHIFSFFTLHWIQEEDQKNALSNIYSMLVPGGDCALVIISYHSIFDTYRVLATKPAWSQYMYDTEKYISPYHDSQNPEEDFRNLMSKCGFSDVDVHRKDCFFDFGELDHMKRFLTSVNPFVHRMSPTVRESFLDDYMQEQRIKMECIYDMRYKHKRGRSEMFMTLLYAYGAKSFGE